MTHHLVLAYDLHKHMEVFVRFPTPVSFPSTSIVFKHAHIPSTPVRQSLSLLYVFAQPNVEAKCTVTTAKP